MWPEDARRPTHGHAPRSSCHGVAGTTAAGQRGPHPLQRPGALHGYAQLGETVAHPLRKVSAMARVRTTHRCTECGAASPKWAGRCATCGGWNTLVEEVEVAGRSGRSVDGLVPGRPADAHPRGRRTDERGAGHRRGRARPGARRRARAGLGHPARRRAGHRQVHAAAAGAGRAGGRRRRRCSTSRPRRASSRCGRGRAARCPAIQPVAPGRDASCRPSSRPSTRCVPHAVVVDSIQTVVDPELGVAPGSVVQVRECAHRLVQEAKRRGVAVVLVGHVTKEGGLAGPRVLEHVVDTVLSFEGDRHHALRLLRAVKHRFGSTNELGLFEMTEAGPGRRARPERAVPGRPAPGRAGLGGGADVEGQRPLLVEVQALVATGTLAVPRRSAQGLDHGRLALLLAVLEQRAGLALGRAGRLRVGRRRRAARRAGQRPRRLPGAGLVARRCAGAGRRRGLRRGRPRRRAAPGRPRRPGGSPRRPGSASPGPSCPRRPPTASRG